MQNAYFSAKFTTMRKILYPILTFICLLTSCSSEKKEFILKGEISGLSSDTLLVYYQVPEFKLDTIICKNGIFEYTISPDTTTYLSLLFNAEESLPVVAEKGQTVQVKGSTSEYEIKGEGENKLMNDIISLLQNTPERKKKQVVDSLVKANPQSFTNIYLIDKYYLHDSQTNLKRLEELIASQSGIIKDTPPMTILQGELTNLTSTKPSSIHTLSGFDRKGEALKWSTIRDCYILIDFWASWHPQSVAAQDSLQSVIKALKKENFIICSVSLDVDKEAWLKASDRDTTQWYQVCDFSGWNHPVIKGQHIQELPSNLLLDKNRRIIARDIRGEALIEKVKTQIQRDKDREKERAKRRKK